MSSHEAKAKKNSSCSKEKKNHILLKKFPIIFTITEPLSTNIRNQLQFSFFFMKTTNGMIQVAKLQCTNQWQKTMKQNMGCRVHSKESKN